MKTLLIVDDDYYLRKTLREITEHHGYKTLEASNGKDAVNLILASPPDVALIDLIMPEKEGVETILELKNKYSYNNIIAMTGGGIITAVKYLNMVKNAGVKATLKKPFSSTELIEAIENLNCDIRSKAQG